MNTHTDTATLDKGAEKIGNKHGIKAGHPIHAMASAVHKKMTDMHKKDQQPSVDDFIDAICGDFDMGDDDDGDIG